jgi:hypothetical protein
VNGHEEKTETHSKKVVANHDSQGEKNGQEPEKGVLKCPVLVPMEKF